MQIERLRPECISCLVKKYLEDFPEGTAEAKKRAYMQQVLKLLAEASAFVSAPMLVRSIDEIHMQMFGFKKDFSQVKCYFNQLMLEKEAAIGERIAQAQDPLRMAVQYAVTGNYIDFGVAVMQVEEEQLDCLLEKAVQSNVSEYEYMALKRDLLKGKRMVYLTDNCGEIVLDKLLIREIKKLNPALDIAVIVRGDEVLNDATMADARQTGLSELVKVIGNGSSIAGTCLEEISREALQLLDSADLILAMGQANFETLRMCGKNIYYIFMCKCEMFAKEFQVPQFSGILINDKNCVLN